MKDILSKRLQSGMTRKELSDSLGFTRGEERSLKSWEISSEEIPTHLRNKILEFPALPYYQPNPYENALFTQIDLFAGIGGIRLGFQNNGGFTVFSSELNKFARKTYETNFGDMPSGDITLIESDEIPDHDLLLAGFPCQPFSQAGLKKGFEDTRGTLFFEIARIIKDKRPKAFMLENVKQLATHDKGNTLEVILNTLRGLNYYVPEPKILNAYHFGIPQNRERIFIVGFDSNLLPCFFPEFKYPNGMIDLTVKLGNILESNVLDKFTISDKLYQGHLKRKEQHQLKGNGFGFKLFDSESKYVSTISARYYKDGSEALVSQNGKNPRMLTPREIARLQGFPEDFVFPVSNSQAYRQLGNSVCIPVIEAIAESMIQYLISLPCENFAQNNNLFGRCL